jgi:glucose-1-phosphate thymidylyltransferase
VDFLGSGSDYNARFTYEVQDRPEGLAQAFLIGERFIGESNCALILGDNIFEDDFSDAVRNFRSGARIFAKEVTDPERFGVVEFDDNQKILSIEEKPAVPKSRFAQTGFYLFDPRVVSVAKSLRPSARGELEITDLTNHYLSIGELSAEVVEGDWVDAGTFESLYLASKIVRKNLLAQKNDYRVGIQTIRSKTSF